MSKKNKYYINDPKNLNIRFYQGYDEKFLLRKAGVIVTIVDDIDEFGKFMMEEDSIEEFEKDKYVETFNAELHFSEFHQFEAFFAILIAIYQEQPHWLFLTTYRTSEIKEKVKAYLESDIVTVSEGFVDNKKKFINEAIYANFISDKKEISENWDTNLDNIDWFITRLAKKYIEGEEFNAYKHGLRTLTGHTFLRIFPTGEPQKGIQFDSGDSLRFLKLDKIDEHYYQVKEIIKHFNPIESLNHIYFMSSALETIKSVRLARLEGKKKARLNTFVYLDRNNLNSLKEVTQWSFPV